VVEVNKFKKTKISSVFIPTEMGRWTEAIITSFTSKLTETGLPFEFHNHSWLITEQKPAYIVDTILKDEPDVVFLPDDRLYRVFAKEIEAKSDALILFVTFYTKRDQTNLVKKQAGVFCDPPLDYLLTTMQKIKPVTSIGIIGGPFAKELVELSVEKLEKIVKVKYLLSDSWEEYSATLQDYANKFDAVWPLPPFGVKNPDGSLVQLRQLATLMDKIQVPALGFGVVTADLSTINLNIDPKVLGETAAYTLFSYFKTSQPSVLDFKSYVIGVNSRKIHRFNLTLPDELTGFVTLRE
jgi:hypothetical protein